MSFQINIPPSMVAKMTKNEETIDESTEKKKKEDWRKIKELEEARKAGTAPAMQDEEGKDINPHIPQYIMQAPWYTGAIRPTLQHQREPDEMKKEYSAMNEWYKKGVNTGKVATKFREGACDNCGAMGHKKKDCLERPRTKGARYTGNFAPDDFEQPTLSLSFDGKRDRWNGFDSSEYKEIVENYQKVEEVKRELKAKKLENSLLDGEPNEEEVDDEDDEKYADDIAMPGQKFETKQRITVRNLRIREDTAKYLFNLDVNSAFYDPKTRAMRMNPFEGSNIDPKELPYAGDNFVRYSGDAIETIKKQKFAWEAYSKGTDVHVQADPTKLEILHREYLKKKEAYNESLKESIIQKYQGQEYLEVPPKELLLGQNEEYVEYTRHGTLAKGNKKAVVRSRYEEDVLENNHKAIWGSYWEAGMWGYKCCQSLIRGAYCIGEAGLRLKMLGEQNALDDEENNAQMTDRKQEDDSRTSSIEPTSLFHQHLERKMAEERKEKKAERKKRKRSHNKKKRSRRNSSDESSGDDSSSGSDDDDDERKVKKVRLSEKHKKEKSKHKKNKKSKKNKKRHSSSSNGSQSSDDDDALKEAIEKQKKKMKEFDEMMSKNERDLPFNVTYDIKKPTEEESEAYQRLRMRPEDPMANYFKK